MEKEQELKKTLGFFPTLATVMGTVIGGGVFFKAAAVFQETGTASLGMFAWFLAGVITICAGLTGAELAAAIPKTGGMVEYIRHTYGNFWAFLLGWAQTSVYFPANIAALGLMFSTQVLKLLDLPNDYFVPIAIFVVVIVVFLNFLGSKVGGIIQSVTLVIKLIPIALIVIFGLLNSQAIEVSLFPITAGGDKNFFEALGNGLLATMFAYDGWIHVGNVSGEMKNPRKDLPKAIVLGITLIMIIYLLINMAYLMALPLNDIMGNATAPMDVAKALFGNQGGTYVTIGILISVFGTINGYTLSGMRIPFAMSKAGDFPSIFQKLSKTASPIYGGILILIIAIIMMFSGKADDITDMLVFVIWCFYTFVFIAVIILRKREPELDRPYKVPLYPLVPLVAIIGGVFIIASTLITKIELSLLGIGITLLGVPLYIYIHRNDKKEKTK